MSTSFPPPRDPSRDGDHPLARAFRSFTEAAGSLERTYGQLQRQVSSLRQELEVTNRNLTASLEENQRIRERLRRILECLPCGVLVVEGEERISSMNPEATRLLGKSFENLNLLPRSLAAALARGREGGEEQEVELRELDSGAQWVAVRHAWVQKDDAQKGEGNAGGSSSVFILRDLSIAKQLDCEREKFRRQQALAEMSALLAHEIRNPLGSLELFAGLLAETITEGEACHWVEHVQAGLRSLSSTVNNVLALHSQPQAEQLPLDMGALLHWAYDFLLPLARQARVELQVVNELSGVFVAGDRHLLEQVLLNLALNAFHFMPSGGWLVIQGVDRGSGGVEIEIRDTGSGIAEKNLGHIFEAGFTTRPGSTGLGLAVCRRIMEQHGGTIAAESKPGRGSIFRLELPGCCGSDGTSPAVVPRTATEADQSGEEGATA